MQENNKRIAKNTIFLYFRMLIMMGVSLYTSRIVLNALGVEDYGIYNVVGGVVVLFSFLNNAMSSATQRFLSFELGRNDINELKRVFAMSMTVHISIVLLVVVLAETVGLWFLNTQMNIPPERMNAANWVYQFSILTTGVGFIRVPYSASIIAYEKMSFYAYVGIAEALLKLSVAFWLVYISYEKLKLYAVLIFLVTICVFYIYKFYCNRNIATSKYSFFWDMRLYEKLMSFSGWSLFGSVANVSAGQGVNILLNIFHGVVVNAAMGIANQVNGALNHFVSNFQTAFKPQIVKLYAAGEKQQLEQLIYRSSKYSFFLLFVLSVPILLNIDFVLKIWLKTVPQYAGIFCTMILICSLLESLSGPLWMSVQATGKIKKYQIVISSAIALNIILSYIFLKLGAFPPIVLFIKVLVDVLCFSIRLVFIQNFGILKIANFFKYVLWKIIAIVIISIPLPFFIHKHYTEWQGLFFTSSVFLVIMIFSVYYVALTKQEKKVIVSFVYRKIHRNSHVN
jgi:O-antigen/teichoic acid export membrane protein